MEIEEGRRKDADARNGARRESSLVLMISRVGSVVY